MQVLILGLLVACIEESKATYILDTTLTGADFKDHRNCEDNHEDCPSWSLLCDDHNEVRKICPHTCDSCGQESLMVVDPIPTPEEIKGKSILCSDTMIACPQLVKECIANVQIRRLCPHTCDSCDDVQLTSKGRLNADYEDHRDCEDNHEDCPNWSLLCNNNNEVRWICPYTCDSCGQELLIEEEPKLTPEEMERKSLIKCNDRMIACPQLVNECIPNVQIRRLCPHTCDSCEEVQLTKKGRLSI